MSRNVTSTDLIVIDSKCRYKKLEIPEVIKHSDNASLDFQTIFQIASRDTGQPSICRVRKFPVDHSFNYRLCFFHLSAWIVHRPWPSDPGGCVGGKDWSRLLHTLVPRDMRVFTFCFCFQLSGTPWDGTYVGTYHGGKCNMRGEEKKKEKRLNFVM